jgi:hypothetical protein
MQLLSEDWTPGAVRRWAPYSTQETRTHPGLFWAPNVTRISVRCHFAGPKKVSISRAQPLLLALVMDAAHIKSITHAQPMGPYKS